MRLFGISGKKLVINFLLTLILFTLCSCISYHNIPAEWEVSESSEITECGNISGSYLNLGEHGNNYKKTPLITDYLFASDKYFERERDVDLVVIVQEGQESIKVTAFAGDRVIKERTLLKSSGDFSCKKGMVKITNSKVVCESIIIGVHHLSVGLTKQNNYILAKHVLTAVAPILIPMYGRKTSWERFLEK